MNANVEITGKHILLYDNVCKVCDGLVQLLLAKDMHDKFRFAAQQRDFSKQYLLNKGINPDKLDTVYLILNYGTGQEKLLDQSTAVMETLIQLGGAWSLWRAAYIFPKQIRDFVYRLKSRNRYRIFGKLDACKLPTLEQQLKFID